jgi:hypothetical protein
MCSRISRRILTAALAMALALWAGVPPSLAAAPAPRSGMPAAQAFQGLDVLDQVRRWLGAIRSWQAGVASDRAGLSHPANVKPKAICGADPDGQQCTNTVVPKAICGADPNGGQQCPNS